MFEVIFHFYPPVTRKRRLRYILDKSSLGARSEIVIEDILSFLVASLTFS